LLLAIVFTVAVIFAILTFRPHYINPNAQTALDAAGVAIENPSKDGFSKAIEEYKRATALEPKWAQAWAELAYAYAAASNARYIDGQTALRESRTAALRAIQIDPSLAKAQGALAWTQSLDFDEWPKAEDSFRTALKLSPEDGQIHYWFGVHLRKKGRYKEAEQHDQLALRFTHQRDPNIWCELAFLYWTSGQVSKLHQHLQEQMKTFPNFPLTRFLSARLLKIEGDFRNAEDELSFAEKLGLNPLTILVERASLEKYEGNVGAARRDIARIVEASHITEVDGLLLAGDYAGLNEYDEAFAVLEAAYRRKDNTLLSLATSPVIQPLRQDPRYISLLKRLHFTDQIMQQIGFN
jgi:Tfp pilus assembly protein PilF